MVDAGGSERQAPGVLRDAGVDAGEVYVVGVRESADPASWSLVFMEPYDAEDEDEIAMGMDTYCLVVDPGQATFYGGVIECAITDDRLYLLLSEPAAEALGTPTQLEFTLVLSSEQLEILRSGLARVLRSGRSDAVPRRLDVQAPTRLC
jgi:hypothetical protein